MTRLQAAGAAVLLVTLGATAADTPKLPARPPTVTAPLPADVLAEAVRAEQDAYIRRLDVCTKLKQVAAEKGDESLSRRADELEKLAGTLYTERVAKLGVNPPKSAELKLDKMLGRGAAVNPLMVAPPKPAASETAMREVKP